MAKLASRVVEQVLDQERRVAEQYQALELVAKLASQVEEQVLDQERRVVERVLPLAEKPVAQ